MTTAEIRWFYDKKVSFDALAHSLSFSEPSERVDYYLLRTGALLGVKWREGNMEVKQQQALSQSYTNGPLTGEVEFWKKWSFVLDNRESYSEDMAAQPQHWIAIRKQRQMARFAYDTAQQIARPVSPDASLPDGCDLEITSVTVAERTYATLGLEAFGKEASLHQNLLSTIEYLLEYSNLEGLDLSLGRSNNYARWIHAHFSQSFS